MLSFREYIKPETLDQAFQLLTENRRNTLLGGCGFLHLGNKRIRTAIDLSGLGLDFIEETDTTIEIGAMTTLRTLETSHLLNKYCSGVIPASVKHIVGVQLRNLVTVGGTVYSRYGFSDLLTALLVLDAQVVLHGAGKLGLAEFLQEASGKGQQGRRQDLLLKVVLPKTDRKAAFMSLRGSQTDYPVLNAAVSALDGDWKIAVGARPGRASLAPQAAGVLTGQQVTQELAEQAGQVASQELVFGTNARGSKEYRSQLCRVLVARAVREVSA
ncbi:MAG TPA: FAD binding domain-containing protein [Bacillota bacterium]|nr:FAD binding domain-containing protein [Bacillota bacterium]